MKKRFKFKNIIILLIIIYIGYIFINQQVIIHRVKKEIVNSQVELRMLESENNKLKDELELSKTDKFLEKLARERLGLIKKGETPVINNAR